MLRYVVGIDLGTTHTVVAYGKLQAPGDSGLPRIFEIEQLVAPGEIAPRPLLPSMRYHPAPGELPERDMLMPWPEPDVGLHLPRAVVGELARELGSRVPGRLVSSAKSWLSHRAADRTDPILPWGAPADVDRISPLHASAGYLAHVRAAWNQNFPRDPLQDQEVILTVPASFDEAARALTLRAAAIAGLAGVRLVEEPQAACYDWLLRHRQRLATELEGVRLLLVCDVGGGTTDFTLIRVDHEKGKPRLSRIKVGDHLMLGGDNMDLALAHLAESRIVQAGTKLGAGSLSQLIQQCRSAKELLLSPGAPGSAAVTVLGAGSRLIGAARSAELGRDEVRQMLVEGFYPRSSMDERPQRIRGGIVEFGLPFVADPAVTRHLAAFLERPDPGAADAGTEAAGVPDAVLLNGGVFRSAVLTQRLLSVLHDWRNGPVRELANPDPHLAVARGAVAYGLARRGRGVRIGGGSARSYFLLLESAGEQGARGVCILPRGTEEAQEIRLEDRTFSLRLGQPVRFHLVSSTGGPAHRPGELVDLERPSFTPLPPIATVLPESSGMDQVRVQLATTLTEVGTLEMSCVAAADPAKRWKLEFQLRGGGKGGVTVTGDLHPRFADAVARIGRIFGSRARDVEPREVKNLRRDLEGILGARESWDAAILREMFDTLWSGARRRRRSAEHERVWFNLAGYCLRPGFGYPLDDWRIQLLQSIQEPGVQNVKDARVWSEWWTLWRRVAGGLDRQAQERLFGEIAPEIQPGTQAKRGPGPGRQGYEDMVRLAGGLERIPPNLKAQAGEWLLERLKKAAESAEAWSAVGRLGARVPFYGGAQNVVPASIAEQWLEQLLRVDWAMVAPAPFAAALIARMSGDRERDIGVQLRRRVAGRLRSGNASPSWIRMVEEVTELDEADEKRVFGESLPPGLRLIH
jgi:molecular chaperone DnaK (HSP70)